MKVSYTQGQNENTEFLGQYPDVAGYPHWYVLESDGSCCTPRTPRKSKTAIPTAKTNCWRSSRSGSPSYKTIAESQRRLLVLPNQNNSFCLSCGLDFFLPRAEVFFFAEGFFLSDFLGEAFFAATFFLVGLLQPSFSYYFSLSASFWRFA